MRTVSKETPISEITLRKFEKPYVNEPRQLMRKFCISLGLLQPGDSRDIIVDLMLLFNAAKKQKVILTPDVIYKNMANHSVDKIGMAPSNIRRHLKRLKDMKFIEKYGIGYRTCEWMSFEEMVDRHIHEFLIKPALERIKEYASKIEEF
ncbi:MAG: hypothetical protein PHW96_01695 [Candidatus Nanoarchaeia archaeon]|nr:hypothetical protein [Candidatus Nanoarchaeia archaeon]